jgi:putative transposase
MDGKGGLDETTSSSSGCGAVKYEEVYLRAYDSVSEAHASIGRYLDFITTGALVPRHRGFDSLSTA